MSTAENPGANPPLRFVIGAPTFDDQHGGAIALHLLCDRLTRAGHHARLWPGGRLEPRFPQKLRRFLGGLRHNLSGGDRRFSTGPFPRRLARYRDLTDAIVVYPETVRGNPLGARHVVRWLLHRPGFFTGQIDYGPDDLYFFFMKAFDDPSLNPSPDNELRLTWNHPAYRDHGRRDRSGACYLLRKGADRPQVHPSDAICVDGLSHEETSAIFNQAQRFYCYDLYTRYAYYAAMCGCVPIIVPQDNLSRSEWMPFERDRFGLAYGEADIGWALETRPAFLQGLRADEETERKLLEAFVEKCRARFRPSSQ